MPQIDIFNPHNNDCMHETSNKFETIAGQKIANDKNLWLGGGIITMQNSKN